MLDSDAFDIDEIIARAEREVAGEEDTDSDSDVTFEEGPGEGELSDEDESGDSDEDLENEEEELEADDEDYDDEVDEDDDEGTLESEDEETTKETETEEEVEQPNLYLEELKLLKESLRAEREAREQLQAQLLQQTKAPQRSPEQAEFRRALHLLTYGKESDKEEWERLPALVRSHAQEFSRIREAEEIEYALNPGKRFEDHYRKLVVDTIRQELAPLQQERHNRAAREAFEPYLDKIPTAQDKQRLAEIMRDLPGATSPDWNTQKKVLQVAFRLYETEKKEAELAKKTQKVTTKERQQKANRKARKRNSPRGRRGSGKKRKVPTMKLGDDLEDYARKLEQGGYDLDEV